MGNAKNAFGKPVFDDVYTFPQDSQAAVDFADEFANVRVGTSAERQALPVGKQRPGMLFSEGGTGLVYRTDGAGAWKLVASAGDGVFASARGTQFINVNSGVTVTFPSGLFTVPPVVIATPVNAGSVVVPHITNLTKDSFFLRIYLLNGTAATGNCSWEATQATAASAGG